jgi:DnaJ-class molecular chaperone
VHVQVEIPRKLDGAHEELLRQIADERKEEVADKKGFLGSLLGGRKK